MRVIWLTETATFYDKTSLSYNGRGWIGSLQKLIENNDSITELAIVFPHENKSEKLKLNKTVYYPVKTVMPKSFFNWVKLNWQNNIQYANEIYSLKLIIDDFKPDLIHVFGTESWFINIVTMTKIPVIVHIQGLLNPIANLYYPNSINNLSIIFHDLVSFFKGNSIWHYRRVLLKKAHRESNLINKIKFFMGRTDWDKSVSGLLSNDSEYFHVDEVLRDSFYNSNIKYANKDKLILTSTISNVPYKGLDLIIKTAKLLKSLNIKFEWKVIGINENQSYSKYLKSRFKTDFNVLNIHLMGVFDESKIIDILNTSSFYIHTSYIDNSPNSICEAQILGVPVISTNVGGISSLIEEGKTGFLVPSNDPYYLTAKILELSKQTKLLEEVGQNSKNLAFERHDKERIQKQLLSAYATVLKKIT